MNEGITRVCRKCGVEKPLEEFGKRKSCRGGRGWVCKPCAAAYSKEWTSKNKERKRESTKRWRLNNKEKLAGYNSNAKEYKREWYKKNRGEHPRCGECGIIINGSSARVGKCKKCYAPELKTRIRETAKKYLETRPDLKERNRIRSKAYYRKNIKRSRETSDKWKKENREECLRRGRMYANIKARGLHDSYLKGLLVRDNALKGRDTPPALIEIKRLQITLKRMLKNGSQNTQQP